MIALPALLLALAADARPSADESTLLQLINKERSSRHLALLAWDPALAALARLHAADMRAAGRISHHSTADGADFAGRLSRTDYRASAAAENVAFDQNVSSAHHALMNSPGHRANILGARLAAVGIGVLPDNDGSLYVVEDFATPLSGMDEKEALAKVRDALQRARRSQSTGSFEEDRLVSDRLARVVERMAEADSVQTRAEDGFPQGWVFSYTAMDPTSLPQDVRAKATKASAYALAISFRKTSSYPFGVWWIAVALSGKP